MKKTTKKKTVIQTAEDLENEVWVEVRPDLEFCNGLRVFVSNFGRVKTDSRIAKGRLLKGSILEGYKAYHFRYFKTRTPEFQDRIKELKGEIAKVKLELREAMFARIREDRRPGDDERAIQLRIEQLRRNYYRELRANEKTRIVHITYLAHRLVAEVFTQKPSEQHNIVIHLDYDKMNNHVDNVKWVTQEEASIHQQKSPAVIAEKVTRKGKRSKSRAHKLNPAKVAKIKLRLLEGNVTLSKLAKQYKITPTQLKRIQLGENWGDIEPAKE
jgi:hypothetical protein